MLSAHFSLFPEFSHRVFHPLKVWEQLLTGPCRASFHGFGPGKGQELESTSTQLLAKGINPSASPPGRFPTNASAFLEQREAIDYPATALP